MALKGGTPTLPFFYLIYYNRGVMPNTTMVGSDERPGSGVGGDVYHSNLADNWICTITSWKPVPSDLPISIQHQERDAEEMLSDTVSVKNKWGSFRKICHIKSVPESAGLLSRQIAFARGPGLNDSRGLPHELNPPMTDSFLLTPFIYT